MIRLVIRPEIVLKMRHFGAVISLCAIEDLPLLLLDHIASVTRNPVRFRALDGAI